MWAVCLQLPQESQLLPWDKLELQLPWNKLLASLADEVGINRPVVTVSYVQALKQTELHKRDLNRASLGRT